VGEGGRCALCMDCTEPGRARSAASWRLQPGMRVHRMLAGPASTRRPTSLRLNARPAGPHPPGAPGAHLLHPKLPDWLLWRHHALHLTAQGGLVAAAACCEGGCSSRAHMHCTHTQASSHTHTHSRGRKYAHMQAHIHAHNCTHTHTRTRPHTPGPAVHVGRIQRGAAHGRRCLSGSAHLWAVADAERGGRGRRGCRKPVGACMCVCVFWWVEMREAGALCGWASSPPIPE